MSPDLIAFLKAWHDWATSGAPEGGAFSRSHGLCVTVFRFFDYSPVSSLVAEEMRGLFGGNGTPFGYQEYWARAGNDTQHECPKRLAWVRERLIEAGELVA